MYCTGRRTKNKERRTKNRRTTEQRTEEQRTKNKEQKNKEEADWCNSVFDCDRPFDGPSAQPLRSIRPLDVTGAGRPGKQSWQLKDNTPTLGFGSTVWELVADDAALQQRLQGRGVIDRIERLGATPIQTLPTLDYTARSGALLLHEEVAGWIPEPERFRQQLETLLQIANLNAEVSPA